MGISDRWERQVLCGKSRWCEAVAMRFPGDLASRRLVWLTAVLPVQTFFPTDCASLEVPMPSPTRSTALPSAEEVLNHYQFTSILLRVIGPPLDGSFARREFAASSATSMGRFSDLCRLLI
jgi:hypothetical protein